MNEPAEMLSEYYRAFSTLDVATIVPYFHQPVLFMGSAGVFPANTAEDVGRLLTQIIENLRARDYRRSEFGLGDLKQLSPEAALATGVAVRYQSDGGELERVALSYLLHNGGSGWKIVAMVTGA